MLRDKLTHFTRVRHRQITLCVLHEILFNKESLFVRRVIPRVLPIHDSLIGLESLPHRTDCLLVVAIGGPDKPVVLYAVSVKESLELFTVLVAHCLWFQTQLLSLPLDLEPVLVCADAEQDVVSFKAFESCGCVAKDCGV